MTDNAFAALGLHHTYCDTVAELGFTEPSDIQQAAIPEVLAHKGLLGIAQTGTGKTAAFSLPLLARVDPRQVSPQILVLTPTRELAIQVSVAMRGYSQQLQGLRTLSIYGGQDYGPQLKQLKAGQHVIVGTPGRVMDHLRRGTRVPRRR